jgi:hypothetical protein
MLDRNQALEAAKNIHAKTGSLTLYIRELVLAGFFDTPAQSKSVIKAVKERFGRRFPVPYVQTYMKPFLSAGVIRAAELPSRRGNLWCGGWLASNDLGVRGAAEHLRIKVDTTGWAPEVAEDFQHSLGCYSSELWKPAAVMLRRAYEGALALKYRSIEHREPEKDATCPKCNTKLGRRPLSISDLHYWAAASGLVREKLEGLSILLKDLGAGGAHPTKSKVIDPDTAEIIVKCGAVLLRDLHSRKGKTNLSVNPPPISELRGMAKGMKWSGDDRDHTERF